MVGREITPQIKLTGHTPLLVENNNSFSAYHRTVERNIQSVHIIQFIWHGNHSLGRGGTEQAYNTITQKMSSGIMRKSRSIFQSYKIKNLASKPPAHFSDQGFQSIKYGLEETLLYCKDQP